MVSAFDCSVIKYAQITFLGGLCRRITKTSRCREEASPALKGAVTSPPRDSEALKGLAPDSNPNPNAIEPVALPSSHSFSFVRYGFERCL